jgi:selenocysteine-specific elongation factor
MSFPQLSAEGLSYGTEPVQWALLQFQHPVYCPIGSLVIGSRLDADTSDKEGSAATAAATGTPSAAQQCRLAFYGPVKAALNGDAELPRTGVYTWRTKECEAFQLTDVRRGVCYEAVLWKLVSGGGSVQAFLGMRVETADKRALGTIVSSYGADGKPNAVVQVGTVTTNAKC